MAKLKNQFTINLDDETAQKLEKLAELLQRKPAELLRLLVVPSISESWIKWNLDQPENQHQPQEAHYTPAPRF